ncbi:MAG: cupin domain-containing protein [Solirubrobacteraceae bacterium]
MCPPAPAVINRDEVGERSTSEADIAFARRRIGAAAGARRIGASLYVVPPGARQMPVHMHGDEEEIFFVLRGDGLSWQGGEACAVRAGDAVVHPPVFKPHTFLAGDDGLELLALGSGSDSGITYLPRARVMWCGPRWVPLDSPHPFRAEGLAGALERPEPGDRPSNVVALADLDAGTFPGAEVRALGAAAGAVKAGLNHVTLAAATAGAPPHCHALEEELFLVLDGGGTLVLGEVEHPLAPGDVVVRPPSSGVAHHLRAGARGLTYLVYGTREPGDSVYYPERGQVRLRGLGVTLDVAS